MQIEHYRKLLGLYKEKIVGNLSDEKIHSQKLEAKIAFDQALVTNRDVDDILEFINELDQL